MKLQLPVMSYAEARRQGYAAITHCKIQLVGQSLLLIV